MNLNEKYVGIPISGLEGFLRPKTSDFAVDDTVACQ